MKLLLGLLPSLLFAQTHAVTLSWQDTVNPAGTVYNIYRSSGPTCPAALTAFVDIAPQIVGLTWTDTTVTPGWYCYYVTASYPGAGESSPSNQSSADVPGPILLPPVNVQVIGIK